MMTFPAEPRQLGLARLWPPNRGGVVARVRCVSGELLTIASLNRVAEQDARLVL